MQSEPTSNAADDLDDDHRLLDFLHERDAPCPKCGYNLRNLTKPQCPECELPLELCVGNKPLHLGSLFTVVVSNSITALLAFINLILLWGGEGIGLDPISKLPAAGVFLFLLLLCGGIALKQSRNPSRFLALPAPSASAIAGLSVFLNLFAVMFLVACLFPDRW